jgi:hypothetical protein
MATVSNGQRTEYLLDPTGMVNVLAEHAGLPSGAVLFTHGLGLVSGRSSGVVSWFDFETNGSTVGVSNHAGVNLGSASYSPFGETIFSNYCFIFQHSFDKIYIMS